MNTLRNLLVTALFALTLVACAGSDTQSSTGEYVDDTVITTKVKTALLSADETDGLDISVETFKGTVQLSGFVESNAERTAAVRIARDIKGVLRVEDKLSLRAEQG